MTPEQQTPASVVEREPVSNPYKLVGASKAFLTEAARYFEARPTGGEDAAHWSNVFNAKNCREAATMIERLSAEREGLLTLLSLARPFVADDTEATCDIADRIDAAISKATGDA